MIFDRKTINERKRRVSESLNKVMTEDEVLLVYSGQPISRPGGHDQTYPFLPHPDYYWVTGIRRPWGISAYTKKEGWIDFVLPITKEERIWEGGGEEIPGKDLGTFDSWLKSIDAKKTTILGQGPSSLHFDPSQDKAGILESFNEVRRVKDDAEIELVRKIAGLAHRGFEKLKNSIHPGMTERDIQIEYESEVLRAGAHKLPYDTIVGTGTNAAVLHAIPTERVVKEDDLILIDAGADLHDYCVDVTRVFPAKGKFTSQQQDIYDLVLKAQKESIALCRPGVEWSEVHLTSARVIAEGLRSLGIMNCSSEEALESGAVSVFFPHGVGHMVGLRVRDVGGKYNPHPKKYAGARLRVDLPLKEGYLMTVEPGLYFIEALLKDEETKVTYRNQINWNVAEKWLGVGGVRLEDDILVTKTDPENLTSMIEK